MLYIFLSRERIKDVPHIKRLISYLWKKTGSKITILLFPEGTDLSDSNIEKSNDFAREHGLQEYRQVLHPKPAGMCLNIILTLYIYDYHNC